MSEVERVDMALVEAGEEGAGPGGGVGSGEGGGEGAGAEKDAGAGGKVTGGVQLPPGHYREEEEGRDGKRRRFIVCPAGRRFERWQDVKFLQRKGKFLDLKQEHFLLVVAKKTGKPREAHKRAVNEVVSAEMNKETANKLTARRNKLKRSLDDLDKALGASGEVDHTLLLEEAAVMLMDFRDEIDKKSEFREMKRELQNRRLDSEHPLNLFPGSGTDDQWAEIVRYCRTHHPKLLTMVLVLITHAGQQISVQQTREVGYAVSLLASLSSGNRHYYNAITKKNSIVARGCGMTFSGIDLFNRMGVTVSRSSMLQMRTEMAVLSENIFVRYAKKYKITVIADNLNVKNCGKSYNWTQILYHCEEDSFEEYPDDDELTLEEALDRMVRWKEYCLLDGEHNKETFTHIKEVTYSVVGGVIGSHSSDEKWQQLKKIFPLPSIPKSGQKSVLFLGKLLPLDENIIDETIKILEEIQDVLLEAVLNTVYDREAFKNDVDTMKNKKAKPEVRQTAGERVWEEARRYGLIVLKGDLLTLIRMEQAKTARRRTSTLYEQLAFVMICRAGMMHTSLNKIQVDFMARMQAENSVDDVCSLAAIKTSLALSKISNDRKKIAKQYEDHVQLLEKTGIAIIMSAWESMLAIRPDLEVPTTKKEAEYLIQQFLEHSKINLFFVLGQAVDTKDKNDARENCSDLGSRALMEMVMDRVTKTGDGLGIRGVQLALIPYLLNKTGNDLNSQYASYLLYNHVDYMRCSSRMKRRLDRYSFINLSGKINHNIPFDQAMEMYIGSVKRLLTSMHARLSPLQVQKSIAGINIKEMIVHQHELSLGFAGRRGGDSSRPRYTEEQLEELGAMFNEVKPFELSEEMQYEDQPDLHSIYFNLVDERLQTWFERREQHYGLVRNIQKF